jgi:shikimate kinase
MKDISTLTLVGMSNVGKSYWSKRLAEEAGYRHLSGDDLIEAELGDVLRQLGYSGGLSGMAKWLGQPYEPQFAQNQQRYLDLESATLQIIIDQLEKGLLTGPVVIDTPGSVVHTSTEICERLRALTTVVYLEATPETLEEMFELYIAEPKPVVWGNIYQPQADETPEEALARCYPKLLAYRSKLYEKMSHITIPRNKSLVMSDPDFFLNYIQDSLTRN